MNGAVLHRGADEAGAVYVVINHLDGGYDVLIPPPGPAYDETGERRFEMFSPQPKPWMDISGYIARQRKSDSDIWVVEIDDRKGLAGLNPELPK